jgi:hypothetical protein
MAERTPWQPKIDSEEDANPFANRTQGEGSFVRKVRSPSEDTAPLQGSKDHSDEDSLVDMDAEEAPASGRATSRLSEESRKK